MYINLLWQSIYKHMPVNVFIKRRQLFYFCPPWAFSRRTWICLHAFCNALSIQAATDDVVTDARKVLDAAPGSLRRSALQVMSDTGNIRCDLIAVDSRTRAIFRSAEFGFLGVLVRTAVQTPLFWGEDRSVSLFLSVLSPFCMAGEVDLYVWTSLPFLTSCLNDVMLFLLS
jgi:hypothetical protein